MKSFFVVVSISLACVLLTACGQNGPLYFKAPPPSQTASSRPLPPAQPAHLKDSKPALPPQNTDNTSTEHFPAATTGNAEPGQEVKPLHHDTQQSLDDNS